MQPTTTQLGVWRLYADWSILLRSYSNWGNPLVLIEAPVWFVSTLSSNGALAYIFVQVACRKCITSRRRHAQVLIITVRYKYSLVP